MPSSSEDGLIEAECGERCLGVGDIDKGQLQAMCNTIEHVVNTELDASVQAIYVMGSFARGEAREVVSDLDIRIQTAGHVPEDKREECEKELKEEYGPDIVPSTCGYLDPHITILQPGAESPHVEVGRYA